MSGRKIFGFNVYYKHLLSILSSCQRFLSLSFYMN